MVVNREYYLKAAMDQHLVNKTHVRLLLKDHLKNIKFIIKKNIRLSVKMK